MQQHRSYFLRAASTGVVNSVASAISVALLLPPLIAHIGLEAYGFWSMLTLFVGLASVLDLGLSKAIVYLTSDGQNDSGDVLSASLIVGGTLALLVALGVIAVSSLGVAVFGPAVGSQTNLSLWIACCGGVILVCCVVTTLLRSVLEASFHLDIVNLGFAALTLLNYGVALALSLITHDLKTLMLGTAAVFVVLLLAHVVAVARLAPLRLRRVAGNDCSAVLRAGFGAYVAELPSVLVAPALLYFFSQQARSGSDYGIFDLALRIATLCATALGSLSSPYFAIVLAARAAEAGDVRRSIARHLRFTIAIALVGWLAFALVGKPVLLLVLRQSFAELFTTTLIALAGAAAVAAFEPVTRMLLGLGRRSALFANRVGMLLTTLVAAACLTTLPLLERFAIAYTIGFMLAAAGLTVLNCRETWGRTTETSKDGRSVRP